MYAGESENASSIYTAYMQPPPKLEDFFACGGDSAETQESSLTHIYDSSAAAAAASYYVNPEQQNLKTITEFPAAFSTNSGSEVDDSAFAGGQTQSPVESAGELVAYSQCPPTSNHNNNSKTIAPTDSESCRKIADTFGQRTSIYRGVTRYSINYEYHIL